MSIARRNFVFSLASLLQHMQSGGFSDQELPGTMPAEAMRVVKNGAAVTAFAAFEHFVRTRLNELLDELSSAPNGPNFDNLPAGMKKAATIGALEGVRFQLRRATDVDEKVRMALNEFDRVARNLSGGKASFSSYTFGFAASNVDGSVLREFLKACDASKLNDQYADFLSALEFDVGAVGLYSPSGSFDLQNMALWRHESAHDASVVLDASILKSRVHAYLALACAFDVFASRAVQELIVNAEANSRRALETHGVQICNIRPSGIGEKMRVDEDGGAEYFAFEQCADEFGRRSLLGAGDSVVVKRDRENFLVDWFFCSR